MEDGTYDATQFNKSVDDVFLKCLNDIVQSGDTIYASVILTEAPKNIETRAVIEGSTTDVVGDQNRFLPFSKDSGSAQVVTLSNSVSIDDVEATSVSDVAVEQDLGGDVKLLYTPESDTFTIGNNVYGVGDKLYRFGKMGTVADGSIVLVLRTQWPRFTPSTPVPLPTFLARLVLSLPNTLLAA